MKHQLTIDYADDILATLGLSSEEFSSQAKFLLSAKLYELGRLSSGQAARLCGKERVAFLLDLPTAGVTVSNLLEEDANREIEFGRGG